MTNSRRFCLVLLVIIQINRIARLKSLGAKVSQSDEKLTETMNNEIEKNISLEAWNSSSNLIKVLYNIAGIKPSQKILDKGFVGALEKHNLRLAKWYHSIGATVPDANKLNELLCFDILNYSGMNSRYSEDYLDFFYSIGATLTEEDFEQELHEVILKPAPPVHLIELLYNTIHLTRKLHKESGKTKLTTDRTEPVEVLAQHPSTSSG